MKPLVTKIKPAGGFSQAAHLGLMALLPVVALLLVRANFVQLALSVIILSKWRMFAVRPRFWPAIVRANSIDIVVGVSVVLFMSYTGVLWWQLLWLVVYEVWLLLVKPASNVAMTSAQAVIGQLVGLSALYLVWAGAPLYGLVLLTGAICYMAARHFFDSFDEPYAKLIAYLWGYFGAAMMWVLGHWMLFYGVIAQATLLLSITGYGFATLYYFDHAGQLNTKLRRQLIFVMVAIILVILIGWPPFSEWRNKVV